MATNEYSAEERVVLLRLAHEAIESALDDREIHPDLSNPHLSEPRGVFTTLYLRERLRGCVGYVFPVSPLCLAIIDTARAAALQDSRFVPVSREEVSQLEVSLSVLSPLRPIAAEEIEIGRHGLLVSRGGQRGILLPQVPVEHNWDRVTFLEQTCQKAGLPPNAWKSGATLEAFTAEVFEDADVLRSRC